MKCPYQDIGCQHIDDVSHERETRSKSDFRQETMSEQPEKRQAEDDEEGPRFQNKCRTRFAFTVETTRAAVPPMFRITV
jgi:hypothetical protein